MEHSTEYLRCNFIPKACAVTGGRRSGGVAGGGMDDVSGGMVVKEGGDGY